MARGQQKGKEDMLAHWQQKGRVGVMAHWQQNGSVDLLAHWQQQGRVRDGSLLITKKGECDGSLATAGRMSDGPFRVGVIAHWQQQDGSLVKTHR
jgi:hypothetical protein